MDVDPTKNIKAEPPESRDHWASQSQQRKKKSIVSLFSAGTSRKRQPNEDNKSLKNIIASYFGTGTSRKRQPNKDNKSLKKIKSENIKQEIVNVYFIMLVLILIEKRNTNYKR